MSGVDTQGISSLLDQGSGLAQPDIALLGLELE